MRPCRTITPTGVIRYNHKREKLADRIYHADHI